MSKKEQNRIGFTLAEVLITLGIIGANFSGSNTPSPLYGVYVFVSLL